MSKPAFYRTTERHLAATRPLEGGDRSELGGLQTLPSSGHPRQDLRSAWITWLAPHFAANGSCYFTGTYSDDYGFPHGCMLVRNVHRDFQRWLKELNLERRRFIVGVEPHAWREVLHLHAVLEGPYTDVERRLLKASWERERGFARSLPVLDGCASYVTKYALKGDAEAFEWRL